MSMVLKSRPAWRRWTPRQKAISQLADALDAALATWPPSSATHRALARAHRAALVVACCAWTDDGVHQ
jgi:hypothetical protein